MNMKKLTSLFLILVLVIVMVLFVIGIITWMIFWSVLILGAIYAYKVLPKMKSK
ncbi:hypothetical protein HOG16_03710 [Candidatus Woesearchaeota archaeon]|jgi:hypothetical protein|nr:hypothetical protein [Candidatus Woesearchaeota archaeon]